MDGVLRPWFERQSSRLLTEEDLAWTGLSIDVQRAARLLDRAARLRSRAFGLPPRIGTRLVRGGIAPDTRRFEQWVHRQKRLFEAACGLLDQAAALGSAEQAAHAAWAVAEWHEYY